jgi:uncharacterized protein (TIGR00725 family)
MKKKKTMIAVFGGNEADEETLKEAEFFGHLAAEAGWIIICGGKGGVMEAVCRGMDFMGGITIGLLPEAHVKKANKFVTIPLATGLGYARNEVLAVACDAACAFGGKYGTLSEIAHTLNYGKPVATVRSWDVDGVRVFDNAIEAFEWIKEQIT